MTPDQVIATIQAGALIFFAGSMWRTTQDHERRIGTLEQNERETALATAKLEGEHAK